MKQSEITLIEAISMLNAFSPIKISLNGIVLYNDYDDDEEKPYQEVIMDRLWQSKDYIITDINVKIVHFHHSIISMHGRYEPYRKDEC